MLSIVKVVGDDLHGEVGELVCLLRLNSDKCPFRWFEMTELEAYVFLDTVEITIYCSDNPAWTGDNFHPNITVVSASK